MKVPRVLLTSGEPAGIGPELMAVLAQESWPAELIVIGDADLLLARAKQRGLALQLVPFNDKASAKASSAGELKLLDLKLKQPCNAGQLNQANAAYVIAMLEQATKAALDFTVDALVTAPVHKGILNEAGFSFLGHTEFFAARACIKQALMLFVVKSALTAFCKNGELKVALATTHLPLAKVPAAIKADELKQSLRQLHQALITQFKISRPKILVSGLNPHAGENGHLGQEELEVIGPVLETLRLEGLDLQGPLSADTLFTEKFLKNADAVLAMYHDQALPVVKCLGFGSGVNVTLGLPFIRTSVDHGTALDLAGNGQADAGSVKAALHLAIQLHQATVLKQPSSSD